MPTPSQRLVDTKALAQDVSKSGKTITKRTTANEGYFSLDPNRLDNFDAVLFLSHVAPDRSSIAAP